MGIFDNATSITINNKEVSSIKIGTATLYEKGEPLNANELIITINGSEFSTNTFSSYDYSSLAWDEHGDNVIQSIDWGDGSEIETYEDGDLSHTYATSGTYTITITCNIDGGIEINDGVFESDNITSIIFPNVNPYRLWFYRIKSENLSSITFTDMTPPAINYNSEDDWVISDSCTIYVPQGSLSDYQRATNFLNNVTYIEY